MQTIQQVQTHVNYTNYQTEKLSCLRPETKTIPGTGPNANPPTPVQNYYQITLNYDYGTNTKVINDFLLEGCEMDTAFGVQTKPGQSGRLEHTIMSRFDATNQQHNDFLDCLKKVHADCGFILQQMKGPVQMFHFNNKMAEATGFKSPIYFPRDKVTGDLIEGKSPSMFLKLFSRGSGPMTEQTSFIGMDGKPISWSILQSVEMKFIPLLNVKRIYVGGAKASIQMEVLSAIVTSVRARSGMNRQMSTIEALNRSQPNLADTVAAQISRITMDRQEQISVPSSDKDKSDNRPTFSNISPDKPSDISIPSRPEFKDILSSAPTRPVAAAPMQLK